MSRTKEVAIIAWNELRQASKDRKILIIVLLYAVLMAIGMQQSVFLSTTFDFILLKIFFFTRNPIPFELLLFYFVSIVALPLFCQMMSYDIMSGSIDGQTMRQTATKASRFSIIAGKYLAVIIMNITINLMLYLAAMLYMFFVIKHLLFIQTLELWLYLSVYTIYFVSLGLLMSSITKKPARSLFLGTLVTFGLIVFLSKGYLAWLSPFKYYIDGFYILAKDSSKIVLGSAVMLCSSAVFFIGSYLIFRRRDL